MKTFHLFSDLANGFHDSFESVEAAEAHLATREVDFYGWGTPTDSDKDQWAALYQTQDDGGLKRVRTYLYRRDDDALRWRAQVASGDGAGMNYFVNCSLKHRGEHEMDSFKATRLKKPTSARIYHGDPEGFHVAIWNRENVFKEIEEIAAIYDGDDFELLRISPVSPEQKQQLKRLCDQLQKIRSHEQSSTTDAAHDSR